MVQKLLIVASIIIVSLVGCGQDIDYQQPEAMLAEDLQCPDGSIGEFNRWGGIDENGWSHSCKMVNGKYHVWRGDILAIEGQYLYGKKDGKWIFRNKKSDVYKIVIYEKGNLLSEEMIDED